MASVEYLTIDAVYPFGFFDWETYQLTTTYHTNPEVVEYMQISPTCNIWSHRPYIWGEYSIEFGFTQVWAEGPEFVGPEGSTQLTLPPSPSIPSPSPSTLYPTPPYTPVPTTSEPAIVAPPVASQLATDHTKADAVWKWKPAIFGADVLNIVGTSQPAEGPEEGRVQKKRKTTETGTQMASSSAVGSSSISAEDTGSRSAWPWTGRVICNVRDSNCSFTASGTGEMRNHLSTAHSILRGKATRRTAEGLKVPKERCPWGECVSVLESSSLRKHLQANHIGAKQLFYVCGHCDKALSHKATAQHEQGWCKGRQT